MWTSSRPHRGKPAHPASEGQCRPPEIRLRRGEHSLPHERRCKPSTSGPNVSPLKELSPNLYASGEVSSAAALLSKYLHKACVSLVMSHSKSSAGPW
jgi:hypothetical protein